MILFAKSIFLFSYSIKIPFIFTINLLSLKWTFFKAVVVDFTGCDHDWDQTNTLHKIT